MWRPRAMTRAAAVVDILGWVLLCRLLAMTCPPQVRSEPFVTGTKGLPNTPGGRADDAVPRLEGPRARGLRLCDRGRSGFGGVQLGARVQRHDPPRRADLHGWCPVHRQLRVLRRIERLPRSGRPLLGHRLGDLDG